MSSIADVRDIFRGAMASLGGFGGRLVARLVLMLVAGQQFGATELGILGQVAAIIEIMAALGVMGLKRGLHNILSHDKKHGLRVETRIIEALIIAFFVGILLSILLLVAWPVIFPDRPNFPLILFAAIPCLIFVEVALTAVKFKRVIRWDVIARCVVEPWSFLVFAVLLFMVGHIENGLLIAYAGSIIMAFVFAVIGLVKTYESKKLFKEAPSLSRMLTIPRRSLPVGITDLGIMMFRRIDILILGLFVGHEGTGIYYMVQQIVTVPQKMHHLFEPMMSPVVAKLHHDLDARGIRLKLIGFCRWVFTIQLGISVPLIVYGDYILALFGPQFAVGAMILIIVLLAELIDGTFALMETPLLFAKPKIPPFIIVATIAIEVVAIYILSSLYGVLGASIGFLVAMSFLTVTRLYMLHRHLQISIIDFSYLPSAFIAVVVIAVLYLIRSTIPTESAYSVVLSIVAALASFYYLVRAFGLTAVDKVLLRRLTK